MFSEQERQHPEWELESRSQRKLSAALYALIAVVVILNLAGGWTYNFWQKDRGVAVASLATGPSYQ